MGLLDDYFDGYYSEEMIESQVIIFLIFFVSDSLSHVSYFDF